LRSTLEKLTWQQYHEGLFDTLKAVDGDVYRLVAREFERQRSTIQLIAAENQASRAVLAALGSIVQDKTTEGFAGARFHGGCEVVDEIEQLAAARAREAFGACYANVQPHSGTTANQIILSAILDAGDRILSLGLDQGGHLSHGAGVSFTGKFFEVSNYGVDGKTFLLDYEAIRAEALRFRPRMIICGATAYCRRIDFGRFRRIADETGAFLLADISHISALVIGGVHPSPVDEAHFTTTSTYKPGGPRGGLILMGRDWDMRVELCGRQLPLWQHVQRAVFPGFQGTPYLNNIAAKAVFFKEALSREYRARQARVVENAASLAARLIALGHGVLTGGTDNHMVLVNVSALRPSLTGLVAQGVLEDCGSVINKNRLPYDPRPAAVAGGIRLGTPVVTRHGMGPGEMDEIAGMVDEVLRAVEVVDDRRYRLDESVRGRIRKRVACLCDKFARASDG
jgi:glycine hydroxymethyltransferase